MTCMNDSHHASLDAILAIPLLTPSHVGPCICDARTGSLSRRRRTTLRATRASLRSGSCSRRRTSSARTSSAPLLLLVSPCHHRRSSRTAKRPTTSSKCSTIARRALVRRLFLITTRSPLARSLTLMHTLTLDACDDSDRPGRANRPVHLANGRRRRTHAPPDARHDVQQVQTRSRSL